MHNSKLAACSVIIICIYDKYKRGGLIGNKKKTNIKIVL